MDAEELEAHDTDVSRIEMINVVADDDELKVEVKVDNVIRCGRGGASTLFLGLARQDLVQKLVDIEDLAQISQRIPDRETGHRVNRIRILGPSGGTGFVKFLIIRQPSVFGKIEIKDAETQDLILRDVTLEDDDDSSGE